MRNDKGKCNCPKCHCVFGDENITSYNYEADIIQYEKTHKKK